MYLKKKLIKDIEKDLTAEQKKQFETYQKDLLDQIRQKKDMLESEREKSKRDLENYPGMKLGQYNPNFKELLKKELERQIQEKKTKDDQEKSRKLVEEKERLRKVSEAARKTELDSQNYQMSMKRKLKEMVKGEYDKARSGRDRKSHLKLVDKDFVPELDYAAPGIGIGHIHDVEVDTPTRMRDYHLTHDINRKETDEDDYWFVKKLAENEQKIMHAEEKTKKNVRAAMEKMMHDQAGHYSQKVIVGSKLRHKH